MSTRNERANSRTRGKSGGGAPPIDLLPSEAWAWQAVREGKVADFHARLGDVDVGTCSGWDQARELRPEFLGKLAFEESFRSQIPPEGVRIAGAWITGSLDWDGARLAHPWRIERSRVDGKIYFERARTSDDLSFNGCVLVGCELADARVGGSFALSAATVTETVDLSRAEIALHIFFAGLTCGRLVAPSARIGRDANLERIRCDDIAMQDSISGGALLLRDAKVASANFKRARFNGHANLNALTCTGSLELEGVDIGSDLFLNYDSRVGDLGLAGARVQGQVSMEGLICEGRVNLNGLGLREDLYLSKARLNTLDAIAVVCGGQVNLEELKCSGDANFQSLQAATDVLMADSRFSGDFSLMSAKIDADLLMGAAEFAGEADLQAIQVSGDVLMPDAKFGAALYLRHATVGLALGMQEIRVHGSLEMNRAQASSIDLTRAKICGPCVMNRTRASSISLIEAECGSVTMRFSEVDNWLDFARAKLSGQLDMSSSQIGRDIFLQNDASFSEIDLSDANVRGTIVARRSQFNGKIKAHSVVAGYVWLHSDARFEDEVNFKDAQIDISIDLGGAHFERVLNLAGCQVGSLDIGSIEHGFPSWGTHAELNLRDATARTLEVKDEGSGHATCPPEIALGGFIYERIAGSNHGWLMDWLKRDPDSAQSYQQAARILTKQDEARLADKILYEGREQQRRNAPPLQQVIDWAAKLTIGYGIGARYFRSLYWVVPLTLVGALAFARSLPTDWSHPSATVLFSLGELLPVIDLSPGADDIAKKLTGSVTWYLAFHRACGFLLGTMILAGLSGLTKK